MSTAAVIAPIPEEAPEAMNEKTTVDDSPARTTEAQVAPTASQSAAAPAPQATPSPKYTTAEAEPTNTKTTPYGAPDASATISPPPELTPEQTTKYAELLELCKSITTVAVSAAKNAERVPLADIDRIFMTKECLLRYLRATKWDVTDAKKRIEATLTWRREWGVESHTPEYIEIENETGKQVVFGFDNDSRPCLYLNPSKQNTEKSDRQIQHLTFMLERVLEIAPPGVETLALLIDFKSASAGQNATPGQGKQVMGILQNHYPERLGRALVVNIPWWARAFLNLIWPFIDPNTRPKLKFNEDMSLHVPKSHLLKEFKGDIDFTYNHATYWPNFIQLAQDRRRQYEERWKANGSQIGESEFYLKGGEKSKPLATEPAGPSVEQVTEEMKKVAV